MSADAFAAACGKGAGLEKPHWGEALRTGLIFGVIEAITPVIEDGEFLALAAESLPAEPWDSTTWSTWTSKLKASTGRKGRALFHPLREALTGKDSGPELAALLPLIGRVKATDRLFGRVA